MPQKGVLLFADSPCQNGCTCGGRQVPALEHVGNRPIVHHVLDSLRLAGVGDLVVTGPADVLIDVRACLASYEPNGMRLEYAFCGQAAGAEASLRAAAPLVGAAPCIVHVADGLLGEPLTPHIEALSEQSLDLILLCPRPALDAPPPGPLERPAPRPNVAKVLGDAGIGVFGP